MNILFVCSRNKWRSRTAETIYKNTPGINVKSAGTEASARIKISSRLISWADIIFVMENHHKQRLMLKFPDETSGKKIIILEIPDDYLYMDPELIELIKASVDYHLDL